MEEGVAQASWEPPGGSGFKPNRPREETRVIERTHYAAVRNVCQEECVRMYKLVLEKSHAQASNTLSFL